MDTQTVLALADALRRHALKMGSDLNASHLYAHSVLMRAIAAERGRAIDAAALAAILEKPPENTRAA